MQTRFATPIALIVGASLLSACSGDSGILGSNNLTTSSVGTGTTAQGITPRQDPACAALSQKIDTLRREGVTERVEKAAVGKTTTVQVKRASLATMAELDKANAEFQTKCTPYGVRPTQAYAAPATTGTTQAAASTTSAATGTASSSGASPPVIVAKSPTPPAVVPPVVQQGSPAP